MPNLNSIRARLTLAFMLATGSVVVVACSVLIWYLYFTTSRSVDRLIQTTRRSAEQAIFDPEEPETPREWLRQHSIALDAADLAAVLVGRSGSILQKTQPSVPSWPRMPDGWRTAVVKSRGEVLVIGYPW